MLITKEVIQSELAKVTAKLDALIKGKVTSLEVMDICELAKRQASLRGHLADFEKTEKAMLEKEVA